MSARPVWHTSGRSAAPRLIARALYDAQTNAQGRPEVQAQLYTGNLEQVVRELCTVVVEFKATPGLEYLDVRHERLGWLTVGVEFDKDGEPLPVGAHPLFDVIEVRLAGEDIAQDLAEDTIDVIGGLALTAVMARKSMDQERRAEAIHDAIDDEMQRVGGRS